MEGSEAEIESDVCSAKRVFALPLSTIPALQRRRGISGGGHLDMQCASMRQCSLTSDHSTYTRQKAVRYLVGSFGKGAARSKIEGFKYAPKESEVAQNAAAFIEIPSLPNTP